MYHSFYRPYHTYSLEPYESCLINDFHHYFEDHSLREAPLYSIMDSLGIPRSSALSCVRVLFKLVSGCGFHLSCKDGELIIEYDSAL